MSMHMFAPYVCIIRALYRMPEKWHSSHFYGILVANVQICEHQGHDLLFYMDNTRQLRGVLQGHAKRGGIGVEQIGRDSGS